MQRFVIIMSFSIVEKRERQEMTMHAMETLGTWYMEGWTWKSF